jgi:hypothetical protein
MILISHRGNLNGRVVEDENKPDYIFEAIKQGYNVEIDVWFEDGKFKLGHDEPQYDFPLALLENWYHVLWLHCKNPEALSKLNEIDKIGVRLNYFFHDTDYAVLTSKGYLWSINPIDHGILVVPETTEYKPIESTLGICSDYISRYK